MSMITVQQQINIHSIQIENIANSSVFQIGTSGAISAISHTTGPSLPEELGPYGIFPTDEFEPSLVPLPNPRSYKSITEG